MGAMLTHWCFLVGWLNNKFLAAERHVSDFTPWKTNLWR